MLEKTGFAFTGERLDEQDGIPITVSRWALPLAAAAAAHAIQRAFVRRDFLLAHGVLSRDCVFHSPVLAVPCRFPDMLRDIGAAMTAVMKDVVYEPDPAFGDYVAPHLRGRHAERAFEAVQLLRVDDSGHLSHLTMMIRPLAALIELAQAMQNELPPELLEQHAPEEA